MTHRSIIISAATVVAVMVGAFVAGAASTPTIEGQAPTPVVLVTSQRWTSSAPPEDVAARLARLEDAIGRLRAETGSGWVGHQDDETGFLAEISGGGFRADGEATPTVVVTTFLDEWSQELFGAPADQIVLLGEDGAGSLTSIRAEQRIGDLPVVDGSLVALVDTRDGARLTSIRGRVFTGLQAAGDAAVAPDSAAEQALTAAGSGSVQGDPELVLLPSAEGGRLSWRVAVLRESREAGAEVTLFFVDAAEGGVIASRPGSIRRHSHSVGHGRAATPTAGIAIQPSLVAALDPGSDGQPVQVTGTDPAGRPLMAVGLQRSDGSVVLADTTVPTYDPATGDGGIETYDAAGSEQLPGRLGAAPGGSVTDPEVIAGHALSRYVYDFYTSVFGRSSWDGQGGRLVSTVNFGDATFCNSFFSSRLDPPQMVYGNPCAPGGQAVELTEVEIDTAGHEITHGVTATSSNLLYTGQSGALNESFSDYLGNVIGNYYQGHDTPAVFEGSCHGFDAPTLFCDRNPDGSLSMRYMARGTTFEDYLYILDTTPLQSFVGGLDQDHGGVHLNSAIWNDATWAIRTRLAQIDQTTGLESPRARQFDQAVYTALTAYLTPTSGFLDARRALEQAAVALGVDPVVTATISEVLDLHRICEGCTRPAPSPALPVATSPATQRSPAVATDRIAWLDVGGDEVYGDVMAGRVGGTAAGVAAAVGVAGVEWAGSMLVAMEVRPDGTGRMVGHTENGQAQVLGEVPFDIAFLAGSDAGAAWISDNLYFAAPDGSVTAAPDVAGELEGQVISIGTGAGAVTVGTDQGQVFAWQPGGAAVELVARYPGQKVLAVDAHAGRVVTVTDPDGIVRLHDLASGDVRELSTSAAPFGISMTDEYVVWAEATSPLGGAVAEGLGRSFPDTDIYLHSFRTGITYSVVSRRGQQGNPSLSGNRLAWVDAVNGGDDIYAGFLPEGL